MDKYRFADDQRRLLECLSQPIGIFQFLEKRVVTVVLSNGFCDVFGYKTREQAYYDMEHNMYKYTHPDDVARIANAALRFATEGGTYEVIYRTRTKYSDDYRIVHAMGKHVYMDDGSRLAHIWYTDEGPAAVGDDSQRTELNRALHAALHEESLMRESKYDYLTGLPNMGYFFDLADKGKGLIQDEGEVPVLLYMDLCGMKFFNTQNGYAGGDNLLREFAKVLKDTFGDRNCGRMGADHFAAYAKLEGIEDTLGRFFHVCERINGGKNLPVSVGIYTTHLGDVPVSTACDRAKMACDSLRNTYESLFAYFDRDMLNDVERRRHVLTNLDRAIEERWIEVHYQPIVRAVNGRVCAEESLARWVDPHLGTLSPIDFVPVLEDAGTIYKLDLYVLEQTLQKMKRQQELGVAVVPHSINLSRSDFVACDMVSEIAWRVDAAGIDRSKITIEITESIIGGNIRFMRERVNRFRELGFCVWMDDFGSGYSSIDLLQSIDFDLIKFDMSFLRRLDEGHSGRIVLTELVKMATALGIETLCEGVETLDQVQFLQEIGCSRLQGYYYCKPISLEQITKRYEQGIQIGYENPKESAYYESVGCLNLNDLSMLASGDADEFQNYFDVLPMAVLEVDSDAVRLLRSNQSYRDFLHRFIGIGPFVGGRKARVVPLELNYSFVKMVRHCCEKGDRAFFDETLPNGAVVHSFVRHIATNPVTGKKSVAIALLSVLDGDGQG